MEKTHVVIFEEYGERFPVFLKQSGTHYFYVANPRFATAFSESEAKAKAKTLQGWHTDGDLMAQSMETMQ